MKVYHGADASLSALKGSTIAVIGYGIQGSAQALCMRDAGLDVIVGARKAGGSWKRAKADGMQVMGIGEAARQADIICMLAPDLAHAEIFRAIRKHLKPGKTLYFSHGFSIVYKLIKPPKSVDVIMVAPKGPGSALRQQFMKGFGLPALFAVHQDATGKAKEKALALAKAMGFTKPGVFESTFRDEAMCDLFGEQAVLCGGMSELVKAGFDTLVEQGFPPEMAYFEVLYELKLTVDLVREAGLEHMWPRISEAARYGGRTRGKRVIGKEARKEMRAILREIRSGKFAEEMLASAANGHPGLKRAESEGKRSLLEKTGKEIRKKFDFRHR